MPAIDLPLMVTVAVSLAG